MKCSSNVVLRFFFFFSEEGLQSVFPSPATPIPVTRHCSHAGISNHFPLGDLAGNRCQMVGVTLNLPGAT